MGKVNALYIDPDGFYPKLLGIEACWDLERDARTYCERAPVVAHPPCQLWTNMAAVNFKRWGGEHNRPGNDGGTFASALSNIRRCKGVLEHPAFSKAWDAYGLMKPKAFGWNPVNSHEWTCEIWQSAYGHRCQKRTWLYYCGDFFPWEGVWDRPAGTHQIGYHDKRGKDRNKPTVGKHEASRTPIKFAEWLISLAHRAAYGR